MAEHRKLPDGRQSITRRFSIPMVHEDSELPSVLTGALLEAFPEIDRQLLADTLKKALDHRTNGKLKFYVTAGMYDDGKLGELFIRADRAGSFMNGVLDTMAMVMSIALQHGVPLDVLTSKMRHTRFPPNGFLKDDEFRSCASPIDLLAQWLTKRFEPMVVADDPQPEPPSLQRDSF